MRRSPFVSAVALVTVIALQVAGNAAWGFARAGTGAARATVMPAGPTPTATASGRSAVLAWSQATMPDGSAVTGYRVARFDPASGARISATSGCAGTVAASTCTEQGVPAGTWQYVVRAVTGPWVGAEGTPSGSVSIAAPALSFVSSTNVTTLPATLSGSVSNFVPGLSLTFRLDDPASGALLGGTLNGTATPAAVPATGGGAFTVTVPAGTSNGAHVVYAVTAANGESASGAIAVSVDIRAPALVSLQMTDADANGKVDRVVATFDETLATTDAAGVSQWTLANVPSGGALTSVAVSGTQATLTLTEGTGAPDTSVGTFTVALAANAAGIRDAAGNASSFGATAPADRAAPVRTALAMSDANSNGKVDRVVATFSESLAPYGAGTTPWTLAAVPSGGTLASVAVSGAQATLTLSEGAGAADTSVGSFTVALAATASAIRDAAGNLSSFAATQPADAAPPAAVSMTMLDANTNGRVDGARITFSEALATYAAGTVPWTTANIPSGGTLTSVAASGSIATLTITEGSGPEDTAVGSFTIALSANVAGVRDAAGNLSSFAATAPADGAAPVPVAFTDHNAGTLGKMELSDALDITFSEAIATLASNTTTITETDPPGGGNDTLTISGLTASPFDLGSNSYIHNDKTSATFASSTLEIVSGNIVRATVAGACSGTCGGNITTGGAGNFTFVPAPTLTDASGNAATGSLAVAATRVF